MTTKAKKKSPAKPAPEAPVNPLDSIADSLHPLHYLDDVANNLGGISYALDRVGESLDLTTIAKHGSEEDRAKVVEYLKRRHYEAF